MRKWFLGVLVGALLAVAAVGGTSAYINGGWPETCLEMNDMVEASPLGSGAVGIYQRAFGGQAEAACQNDHRDDVRRAFAWAIGGASTPTQPSQPDYIYNVTARDIAREFETNEHASTEKYKGKFFRVTGVVEEVKFSDYENDWFGDYIQRSHFPLTPARRTDTL